MSVLKPQGSLYFPALDGIRGWMAIGVLVAHVHLAWFPGAMVLMELFFVISGFLITGIVWRSVQSGVGLSLSQFWWRRLQRLVPALVCVVVLCSAVAWAVVSDFRSVAQDAVQTLLYYSNFTKLYNYIYPGPFAQSWSLAVEEQFYLLWPLLFFAFYKARLRRWQAAGVLLALALACMAWRYYLIAQGAPWSRLYYALDTRMDAFVVGGLLALWYPRLAHWSQGRAAHAGLTLAACAYGALVLWGTPKALAYFYWQQTAAVLTAALLVLLLASPRAGLFQRLNSHPWSKFLGRRCYSIYLWHWPVIWLLLMWRPWSVADKPLLLALVLVLTALLSMASYRWCERPFMRQRRALAQAQALGQAVRAGAAHLAAGQAWAAQAAPLQAAPVQQQ